MNRQTKIIGALLIVCVVLGVALVWKVTTPVTEPLPEWNLTLVNGGTTKVLPLSDVMKLPSDVAWGGLLTSVGTISGPFEYQGVYLEDLIGLVGDVSESNVVRITAEDGYTMAFTYRQLKGKFVTYDPATHAEIPNRDLRMMLAYKEGGQPLTEKYGGPLRLIIVGPDKPITDGHFWIKWITKIEIAVLESNWTLTLKGAINQEVDRVQFEEGVICHGVNWTDAEGNTWTGMPLWLLVGYVDDTLPHGKGAFNETVADMGYTVVIVTEDGNSVSLESLEVKRNNNILVASMMNNQELSEEYAPLRLVGSILEDSQSVGKITMVKVVFTS